MGGTTLDQVIEIAAGETVTPDVSPRLLSSAPAIDSWEWSSATVARTCPS
jgi:hypothetical protein